MSLGMAQRFADVVNVRREFFWETDAQGHYVYVCDRVADVLGYAPEDMIGRDPADFVPAGHAATFAALVGDPMHARVPLVEAEHAAYGAHRRIAWLRIRAIPYQDREGRFAGYRGAAMDVSDRRGVEEQLLRLAHHDPLTELPNRRQFLERLASALEGARLGGHRLAVLLLDLDRFKTINNSLGHAVGDELLVQAGERILRCAGEGTMAARLGGDEFAILVPRFRTAAELRDISNRMLETLRFPFRVGANELRISASIGIAVHPTDGAEAGTLLRCADSALHRAKEEGRRSYCFFAAPMGDEAVRRLALENALAEALERREFLLHFQPIVHLRSNEIVGAEALVRWNHPVRGLVAPDDFFPVAEQMGISDALEDWILATACQEAAAWNRGGGRRVRVAVNLSARRFGDRRIVEKVSHALAASGLDASLLDLELTETAMLKLEQRTVQNMQRLAELGVRLSLDDFGTGYSNLAYLKRLPIDRIKIDRLFIADPDDDRDTRPLLEAILTMARGLGLRTVAEGVEQQSQLDFLREQDCDEVQGFFFSPALPARGLREWMDARAPDCAQASAVVSAIRPARQARQRS